MRKLRKVSSRNENLDEIAHLSRVAQISWSNGSMVLYRERLWPSKWLPLIFFMLVPLFWLLLAPFNADLGLLVGIASFILVLVIVYSRVSTAIVTESGFTYGRATIDKEFIGAVSAFSGAPALDQRRTKLDARAWTKFHTVGDGLVRIEIVDPDDPTPYWLVSTRRPNELATALRQIRAGG